MQVNRLLIFSLLAGGAKVQHLHNQFSISTISEKPMAE